MSSVKPQIARVDADNMEYRIAQVRVNNNGDWILRILGTDVCRLLWRERDLMPGVFPGNAMGHRLIELGWTPDRRRMYGLPGMSPVQKLAATAYAGWENARGEDDKTDVWRIPCYREREC